MDKEYNEYLWSPKQPRVYDISPLRISGTPMSEEDAAMSLRAENLQQSLQQNPIFKSAKQRVAQQEQREKEIAASKKWLELHPEDDNDDPYTIFERGKHQAIVDGKDPSYYEKMINDGKQFTKGALTVLSLPYLGAAAAGAYGYGASLGARGLFAAQGIHGLANENGVRKTANLIKSGDYGRAALSGAGDALNAAMVLPGAKLLGNIAKYGLKTTYVADRLANNVRNVTLPYNIYGNDSRRPLSQFIDTNRNGDSNSYWLRTHKYDKHTGKPLDIRNLDGAKFGDGGYGNDGGKIDGVFMSYGEPWQEFAVNSRDAWYKFPNRSSARSATNWKGDKMDYSVKDAYDAELAYRKVGDFMESIPENIDPYEMGKMRLFEQSKYPILKKIPQAGDRHFANQTVIPKHELTYDSFLKQPFWKYTEDPISGQVQQELFMQWPKNNTQGRTYLGLLERPSKLSEAEPTYYTYVSGNQSINTLNPNDISGAKLAFESRYPESGVIWRTPIKDQYFGDPITIIGEAPMSQDAKNVAQIMKTRFNRFNIPERDADYTLFADVQPVRNGPSGAVDKAINTPTKVFIPENAGSNYGGMYQQGIGGFIRLDPGRSKPYKFTQIHEGLSHPTDYNVKWMTPKSSPNKTVESLYEGVSFPKDLFPEEELVQLLGKDSRKWKEGRAVTWEIINDLNNKLAKQSGISSWAQAHAPEQKLWDFIDNTLKTPDDFIKYVKKFDNAYLNDYAKVLEYYKGTPNVEKYFNRIKSALKYLPAVGIPIGMQYISENNQNNVASNTMKQGGILKRVESGKSGIHK